MAAEWLRLADAIRSPSRVRTPQNGMMQAASVGGRQVGVWHAPSRLLYGARSRHQRDSPLSIRPGITEWALLRLPRTKPKLSPSLPARHWLGLFVWKQSRRGAPSLCRYAQFHYVIRGIRVSLAERRSAPKCHREHCQTAVSSLSRSGVISVAH